MSDNTDITTTDTANNSEQTKRWRDVLPVHPAADLFPLMSEAELRELSDDIEKQGLREPVYLYHDRETSETALLDGRNRFDALELLGEKVCEGSGHPTPGTYRWVGEDDPSFDPYAYVLSKNVHRRHLTADQRRELIAKVLKAKPETSNRQIAKQTKADDKAVAKVRTALEATAEIPQLTKTTGADGKAIGTERTIANTLGALIKAYLDPASSSLFKTRAAETQRDQEDPQSFTRDVEAVRARSAIRHGRQDTRV